MASNSVCPFSKQCKGLFRYTCRSDDSVSFSSSANSSLESSARNQSRRAQVHSSVCNLRLCLCITTRCCIEPSSNQYEWILIAILQEKPHPSPHRTGEAILQARLQQRQLPTTQCTLQSALQTEHQPIQPVSMSRIPNNFASLPQRLQQRLSERRAAYKCAIEVKLAASSRPGSAIREATSTFSASLTHHALQH